MPNYLKAALRWLRTNQRGIFWLVAGLLIGFRLWLITGVPMMYGYFPADDLFYAKAAHYILHGQWMGPYDQWTLVKVPFYPIFIIASYASGLSLLLSETVFWVMACAVLYAALSPLIREAWWRLLLVTLLMYSPPSLASDWNLRVEREFVYFAVTVFVTACAIGMFLRLDKGVGRFLLWSIGLGASMGAFLLTREEGIWIYPAMFCLLLACLVLIWRNGTDRKWLRSGIVLLPIIIWYIPTLVVCWLNYSTYGLWGTTEQLDPDFVRVLNTLSRIKTTTWYPFIQITAEARTKAYQASPLFAALEPAIDSQIPLWQPWDDLSISAKPAWYLQQYSNGGSEIGQHFMWLFRDVVYNSGAYASGRYPQGFYKALADQLESDCSNGRLSCTAPRLLPGIGNVDSRDYPIILRMFSDAITRLLVLDHKDPFVQVSYFDFEHWQAYFDAFKYFDEFTYNPMQIQPPGAGTAASFDIEGKTGASLKMLRVKSAMMRGVVDMYRALTLPLSLIAFSAWCVFVIVAISRRPSGMRAPGLIVSVFLMALFFSRVMVLAIFDATTTIPATTNYAASNYVFIYTFLGLMLYEAVRWVPQEPVRAGRTGGPRRSVRSRRQR